MRPRSNGRSRSGSDKALAQEGCKGLNCFLFTQVVDCLEALD